MIVTWQQMQLSILSMHNDGVVQHVASGAAGGGEAQQLLAVGRQAQPAQLVALRREQHQLARAATLQRRLGARPLPKVSLNVK